MLYRVNLDITIFPSYDILLSFESMRFIYLIIIHAKNKITPFIISLGYFYHCHVWRKYTINSCAKLVNQIHEYENINLSLSIIIVQWFQISVRVNIFPLTKSDCILFK